MKNFLFKALLISFLTSFYSVSQAQVDHLGNLSAITQHPRLLLFKNEEGAIKDMVKADTIWQKLQQAVFTECDSLLLKPPVERIQIGRRLLDKSREALRRLFFLSYGYRMTHNREYLQRAEKEMVQIANFSDWNPSHFLDVAEMTMALSIGYDWLFDELSPTSRALIKDAIL